MLKQYNQESLRDIIAKSRKIKNLSSFISKVTNDIKREISDKDKTVKVHAIQKLIFLYLNNYDIKWANFFTLELLSTCGTIGKRIGHMICQLQYKADPEYIQLLPNLLRKELISNNKQYINFALNTINCICNENLAMELHTDISKLLNLNNSSIRKKLVISMLKIFDYLLLNESNFNLLENILVKFNDFLEENPSVGVAISIISVIQQICIKYPHKCKLLFIRLLQYFNKCEVNWILIKLLDIFRYFLAVEKNILKQDFINIIAAKMEKNKSKSVEVQILKLIITQFNNKSELFKKCEEKLRSLIKEETDANLVLLGLRLLKELLNKSLLNSSNYLEEVLKNLEHIDKYIQYECMDIIALSVDKNNLTRIVDFLLLKFDNLKPKSAQTILELCTFDFYARVDDNLEWFINVLFIIADKEFGNPENEARVAYVIRDIAQRVESFREYLVEKSFSLFKNFIERSNLVKSVVNEEKSISFFGQNDKFYEVEKIRNPDSLTSSLCFVFGEYSEKNLEEKIKFMLNLFENSKITENNYVCLLDSLMKLILRFYKDDKKNFIESADDNFKLKTLYFIETCPFNDLEIMEMNYVIKNLLIQKNQELGKSLFSIPLLPLNSKAQDNVHLPKDFNIDECFKVDDNELKLTTIEKKIKPNLKEGKKEEEKEQVITSLHEKSQKIKIDKTNYLPQN